MQASYFVSPSDTCGKTGGCPEDDPRYPQSIIPSRGLSVIAFSFALALTFLLLFVFVETIKGCASENQLYDFVLSVKPKEWLSYLAYGGAAGVIIAGIYNMLVVKALNLFGLESGLE